MKKIYLIIVIILIRITAVVAQQEATIIMGVVSSANDGYPLLGVSVAELDENNRVINGTVTDMDGNYVLRIKNPIHKIKYSYIGFLPQTLSLNGRKKIDVKLREETQMIAEQVVVAKRTTNDGSFNVPTREVSMAMQKIDAKEFEGLSVASID